jgi:hypothetical protein
MLVRQRPDVVEVHLTEEVVEFSSLAPRQRSLERHERIPGAVLDRHPDEEHGELEGWGRDHERPIRRRGGEVGLFDRQVDVLGHVVADDQLVVSMDMHQCAARRVESVRVIDAGELLPSGLDGVLEPQLPEDPLEPFRVGSVHQQIQIVLAVGGSRDRLVALPMAIPHTFGVEGTTQTGDQHENVIPPRRGLRTPGDDRSLGRFRRPDVGFKNARTAEESAGILGSAQVDAPVSAQCALRSDIRAPPRLGYVRTLCERPSTGTGTMT